MARSAWPEKLPRIPHYMLQDSVDRLRIPAAQISTATGSTLLDWRERLARGTGPRGGEATRRHGHQGDSSCRCEALDRRQPSRCARPQRGCRLEGSDPQLKNEWVVISCHHDHNGADGDRIFNGADDNGSGMVGMLEIAEAYALAAEEGQRPKRSILFASFNSEERGLLGSWAFVERPLVPLNQIGRCSTWTWSAATKRSRREAEAGFAVCRSNPPSPTATPSTCLATAGAPRSPRRSSGPTPASA